MINMVLNGFQKMCEKSFEIKESLASLYIFSR